MLLPTISTLEKTQSYCILKTLITNFLSHVSNPKPLFIYSFLKSIFKGIQNISKHRLKQNKHIFLISQPLMKPLQHCTHTSLNLWNVPERILDFFNMFILKIALDSEWNRGNPMSSVTKHTRMAFKYLFWNWLSCLHSQD